MLWYEVCMAAQPVACAVDSDDHRMMQEAIEQGCRYDRVAEHLAPFGEAAVRCQDHGTFFVTGVDELEQQVGAAGGDGHIADLVDDEQ